MRVLNFNTKKFSVGRKVVAIQPYAQGTINIHVGDTGVVEKITTESFPTMGLINLEIIHMLVGVYHVSMEVGIAKQYFKV